MRNKEKKVIILDKLSSPFIAQAIIILKEDAVYKNHNNIIDEAEKIVSGYFPAQQKKTPKKSLKLLLGGIFIAIGITALAIRLL